MIFLICGSDPDLAREIEEAFRFQTEIQQRRALHLREDIEKRLKSDLQSHR